MRSFTTIGSENGSPPVRRKTNIAAYAGLSSIRQ